ncbi:MAG: succinyl-diaminopimelate desuccinylase [Micrococcaceae bacterium]
MRLYLKADVAVLTEQLININSISDNETELADLVEKELKRLDYLEVTRNQDAIVARTNWGKQRRVILAGHLDTVPLPTVPGSKGTIPATVEDGILYGRGTTDMKGGVAVQLALAAKLIDAAFDITYIFYDHEEVEAYKSGLGRLIKEYPELITGDFAILLEPSDAHVEGGCNGTLRAKIATAGLAAHSGRAWKGKNAIHMLAPVLNTLAAYEPKTIAVEGLEYREGLSAVHIEGGVATNVIPDNAHVLVNYRYAPDKTEEEAQDHVEEVFKGFDVEIVDSAPAARPGLNLPDVKNFVEVVGMKPMPKYGWTDVARFSKIGIPAVNFGPGDPMLAHSDNEHVSQQDIRACYNSLEKWLTNTAEN